jgi:hypothetical protein
MKDHISKSLCLGVMMAGLLTATPLHASNTLTLDFDSISGTVLDNAGKGTGFTTRLAGTGGLLPANDYNMNLYESGGKLEIFPQNSDYNGQVNMGINSAPGINLSTLGFTGTQDFSVTAVFSGLFVPTEYIDQLGVYVGSDSAHLTRAGLITFGGPEYYSVHTITGNDLYGHFYGFGLDASDGMTVTISRTAGFWDYVIDGVHWLPNTAADGSGGYVPASFLDANTDLTVGLFAITPFNSNFKIFQVESFTVTVVPEPSSLALFGVSLPGVWLLRRRFKRTK